MAQREKRERMPQVILEGVPIVFKNFQGQKGQYNEEGVRTFNVVIEDPIMAEEMMKDGWNLKPFTDEDDNITAYHMQVKVNYDSYNPPRIYRVTQEGRRQLLLDQKTVGMLDSVNVRYVDLSINPYRWNVRGESGVKGYVDTMYVVVEENALDQKYASLLDSPFDLD